MPTPDLHPTAAKVATMLAFHCVRNSYLEDLHAGIFPSSQTGDYTDVKVVSPYGEIAWNRLGRISDEVLFGQVWSLPGLELAHRSMITIAALTALGREVELRAHIRGGLNLGLTREQIVEVIIQMAFYAGQPAAHAGFRAAKEVFDQLDKTSR